MSKSRGTSSPVQRRNRKNDDEIAGGGKERAGAPPVCPLVTFEMYLLTNGNKAIYVGFMS